MEAAAHAFRVINKWRHGAHCQLNTPAIVPYEMDSTQGDEHANEADGGHVAGGCARRLPAGFGADTVGGNQDHAHRR